MRLIPAWDTECGQHLKALEQPVDMVPELGDGTKYHTRGTFETQPCKLVPFCLKD